MVHHPVTGISHHKDFSMIVKERHTSGVMLLAPSAIHHDPRGFFFEALRRDEFMGILGRGYITRAQTNISRSRPFTLRGMHYQVMKQHSIPQGKLMRCVWGKIFQACVDVRVNSSTFGAWWGHVIDDVANEAVWVPPGFANGFYAFEDGAVVVYEMTEYYEPELERSLTWDDTTVKIGWPFRENAQLVLSPKDRAALRLDAIEKWKPMNPLYVDKKA